MNFLVDAHLPRRLVNRLREAGHDAIHTLDLPHGNRTPDAEIRQVSIREARVVVTKDADFVHALLLVHEPYKLLQSSTGNVNNAALERLLIANLAFFEASLRSHDFVELTPTSVVVHN